MVGAVTRTTKPSNSLGSMHRTVIYEKAPYSSMDYMDDGVSIDFSSDPSSMHEKAKVAMMFNPWQLKQIGIDVYVEARTVMNLPEPDIRGMAKLRVGRRGQLELYTVGEWFYSSTLKTYKNTYGHTYEAFANGDVRYHNHVKWHVKD